MLFAPQRQSHIGNDAGLAQLGEQLGLGVDGAQIVQQDGLTGADIAQRFFSSLRPNAREGRNWWQPQVPAASRRCGAGVPIEHNHAGAGARNDPSQMIESLRGDLARGAHAENGAIQLGHRLDRRR